MAFVGGGLALRRDAVSAGRRRVKSRWRCVLGPGTVLTSSRDSFCGVDGSEDDELFHLRNAVLLVFEHTEEHGTGALVTNRPTPVAVGDLRISHFSAFRDNLMFQGGPLASSSDFVLGDQAPWYWIHDEKTVIGTTHLGGDIYMGGKVHQSEPLLANPERVKFFWRHAYFLPGILQDKVASQQMIELPCTSNVVLQDEVEGKRLPRMTRAVLGE
mmetsp:Transcript_12118/g.50324  ORF Transcript_12118/g.50324 Transcript_12118/m.50324 type:complete len:214 (+) Transcript_12118:218-859(+)